MMKMKQTSVYVKTYILGNDQSSNWFLQLISIVSEYDIVFNLMY